MSREDCFPLYEWEGLADSVTAFLGGTGKWWPHEVMGNDNGIDAWVETSNGKLAIDLKNNKGYDWSGSLLIETWSKVIDGVYEVRGWTLDASKQTDWVLYTFRDRHAVMLPFWPLRLAAQDEEDCWKLQYGEQYTVKRNHGYETAFILVPAREVWRAMQRAVKDIRAFVWP